MHEWLRKENNLGLRGQREAKKCRSAYHLGEISHVLTGFSRTVKDIANVGEGNRGYGMTTVEAKRRFERKLLTDSFLDTLSCKVCSLIGSPQQPQVAYRITFAVLPLPSPGKTKALQSQICRYLASKIQIKGLGKNPPRHNRWNFNSQESKNGWGDINISRIFRASDVSGRGPRSECYATLTIEQDPQSIGHIGPRLRGRCPDSELKMSFV